MTIHPDNTAHATLELTVAEYLDRAGFETTQQTYHETLEKELVELLQRRYDPTSLYLRGRADRTAIHKVLPLVFEWEAKTHSSEDKQDMTIEALPLAHHVIKARLGVACLYTYHNPYTDRHAGFWVHRLPDIRVILIPNRWSADRRAWFRRVFADTFPNIDVADMGRGGGSGDPFAIIDEAVVDALPHWQDLIDAAVDVIARAA